MHYSTAPMSHCVSLPHVSLCLSATNRAISPGLSDHVAHTTDCFFSHHSLTILERRFSQCLRARSGCCGSVYPNQDKNITVIAVETPTGKLNVTLAHGCGLMWKLLPIGFPQTVDELVWFGGSAEHGLASLLSYGWLCLSLCPYLSLCLCVSASPSPSPPMRACDSSWSPCSVHVSSCGLSRQCRYARTQLTPYPFLGPCNADLQLDNYTTDKGTGECQSRI